MFFAAPVIKEMCCRHCSPRLYCLFLAKVKKAEKNRTLLRRAFLPEKRCTGRSCFLSACLHMGFCSFRVLLRGPNQTAFAIMLYRYIRSRFSRLQTACQSCAGMQKRHEFPLQSYHVILYLDKLRPCCACVLHIFHL